MRFQYSPQEIESLAHEQRGLLLSTLDEIGKRSEPMVTPANSLLLMEAAMTRFNQALTPALFLKYVSTDATVRAAADKAETEISQLFVEIFAREDLFRALKGCEKHQNHMPKEETHLLEEYLSSFRRNGLELSAEKREVFLTKKKRLVVVESEFSKNLVEWRDALEVTVKELDGLPPDYVQGLEKLGDGKFRIALDYPRYYTFMDNAHNAEARRRLEHKFHNRGGDTNTKLMEEAIVLRHEIAQLLGYANHAAYVLERKMARKPDEVMSFLKRLKQRLRTLGERELKTLLAAKRTDLKNPKAERIEIWDWRYYDNYLRKTQHQLDTQAIREYFPLDVVLKGMLDLYQTLLGVRFYLDEDDGIWHPSVMRYRVEQEDKVLAHFYMDLFPREGKYSHAAAFTLTQGHRTPDGSYQRPVSAIVANFNAPTPENPSLLEHSEVETLFHEFGHIMHQILTKARFATFSGTSVKSDFVEAPSQMLENWVWEKESLQKLSGHYRDPSKPLPDDLIGKLLEAKLLNVGIKTLRQLSFSLIDMTYHTSERVDSTEVYEREMRETMLIPIQEGTHPQASFGHLMGGYDAGYYGYLWSKVYAADIYTRFQNEGLLSPRTGADYRRWILEPGGEPEPFDLIRGFLGRDPNEEAFLQSLGLK